MRFAHTPHEIAARTNAIEIRFAPQFVSSFKIEHPNRNNRIQTNSAFCFNPHNPKHNAELKQNQFVCHPRNVFAFFPMNMHESKKTNAARIDHMAKDKKIISNEKKK